MSHRNNRKQLIRNQRRNSCPICRKKLDDSCIHHTVNYSVGTFGKVEEVSVSLCSKNCEILYEISFHSLFMDCDSTYNHLVNVHGYTVDEIGMACNSLKVA